MRLNRLGTSEVRLKPTIQEDSASPADIAGVQSATPVALIMRSKDEQPHADLALEALRDQSYGHFTLYNVDSGSTDGTLEAVRRFNPIAENVIEIAPEAYVPGVVLNDMVARTTEPIIVFLNADAIPQDRFWLERLIAPILSGEADATMSRQIPRDEARFIDKFDFERAYSPRTLDKTPEFFSAVSCAFRRELWEQTKFYVGGYAEDLAWSRACQEKGARFRLTMDSVVEHSHNFTVRGLYRKRYRHGIAYVEIYGTRPNLPRQGIQCAKEVVRDLLHAVRKLRLDTVPYNVVHRVVIHLAYYLGIREGWRRRSAIQKREHP